MALCRVFGLQNGLTGRTYTEGEEGRQPQGQRNDQLDQCVLFAGLDKFVAIAALVALAWAIIVKDACHGSCRWWQLSLDLEV